MGIAKGIENVEKSENPSIASSSRSNTS